MDSDSKLCVVEAEIGQLSITSTTTAATALATMTTKSEAAGKIPERLISSLPPAPATVTVTVQELPIPSPPLQDTTSSQTTCPFSAPAPPQPATEFHLFPLLPAELRLKIWHFSFLLSPRTIELHARRTHYAADDENHYSGISSFGTFSHFSSSSAMVSSSQGGPTAGGGGGGGGPPPKWQSESRNPAALSVSAEARCAALEFYTVRLPLAYNPADHTTHPTGHGTASDNGNNNNNSEWWDTWTPSWTKHDDIFVRERPGNMLSSADRVIYLNLETDMVVLLGDLHFGRLSRLLAWFREQSQQKQPAKKQKGTGLKRLAMSVAPFSHHVGAATLRAFARTVFADVEEFVLFMYMSRIPPEGWDGGRVVLEDCRPDDDDGYRRFLMGRGAQFREGGPGGGWMVVGKRPLRMVDIRFEDGW